jgi:hypothetical protein
MRMRGDVSGRRPPLTVALLVAVVVAVLLYILLTNGVDRRLVGGGALLLLASFGLVRGVWIAWLVLGVVAVGDSIASAFAGPAWLPLAVNLILLALLGAPSTLRHIAPPRIFARQGGNGDRSF